MSLIGLDVGTTGCKAIVFDAAGRVLSQASREYSILTPQPNWAEQDAERVWTLAWEALREAVSKNRGEPPRALALSVQGEAVIPVDVEGRALRHAILGMDTRTGEENRWLVEQFGAETLFARTGMPVHTINTLPKLLWLQRHEPQIWKAARQFLLYEDFFLRRLSGRATISHCLASRTQMYDLAAGGWATDILETCGIDSARLAPLAATGIEVDRLAPQGSGRRTRIEGRGPSGQRRARSGLCGPGQRRDPRRSGHGLHGDRRSGGSRHADAGVERCTARRRHFRLSPRRAGPVRGHDAQSQRRPAAPLVPRHVLPGGTRRSPPDGSGRIRSHAGGKSGRSDGPDGPPAFRGQRHAHS